MKLSVVMLLVVAFVLGWLSHSFVQRPIKNKSVVQSEVLCANIAAEPGKKVVIEYRYKDGKPLPEHCYLM